MKNTEEFIEKHGRNTANVMVARFLPGGFQRGKVHGMLSSVEQEFLQSVDYCSLRVYVGSSGMWHPVPAGLGTRYKESAYAVEDGYELPETPAKPEYFVGDNVDSACYTVPICAEYWAWTASQ